MRPADVATLIGVLISVPFMVLWAAALSDVFQRADWEFPPSAAQNPRLLWTLIVVFGSGIGSAFYYFFVMRVRPRGRR